MPTSSKSFSQPAQFAASLALLALFPILIWYSARSGYTKLLSTYAASVNQITPANVAVSLAPGDPEAHYWRGAILDAANDLPGAIAEYEKAITLRPDDYVFWLTLARVRELSGDVTGAIAAARQALSLAPYYAQPRWQLGNLLVRAGSIEEGFAELRVAAASNPKLLPAIIDLAWQLSRGDAQYVLQKVQPQTAPSYLALAEYFKKRDQVSQAITMLRSAGSSGDDFRRRFVGELLSAKRFADAYAVWSIAYPVAAKGVVTITDPGFERESDLVEPGFGWMSDTKAKGLSLSLDTSSATAGKSSLNIEFKGEADAGVPVITQLIIVAPNTHYQLGLAARSENLVSGGLPQVVVLDATTNEILGPPVTLPQQTNNWQDYRLDFYSKETTAAVKIVLQRQSCEKAPCPIFGRLWLDNFEISKL